MAAKQQPERITLDAFLDGADGATAAQLRAIAAKIDELEKRTSKITEAEASMFPAIVGGGLMSLLGTAAMVSGVEAYNMFEGIIGKVGITILLAGLPVALAAYGLRVYPRSVADTQKMDLNKAHFLPHGALYFPADGASDEQACVVLVDTEGHKPLTKGRMDNLTPGRIW